jgi:probable DNA metabolism protein
MELFDFTETAETHSGKASQKPAGFNIADSDTADCGIADPDIEIIEKTLEKLKEVSPNARANALHALLYGFSNHNLANPPVAAIKRFMLKVLAAAEKSGGVSTEKARRFADLACNDRLDPDTEQVKAASFKVIREFDRLRGLLRFKPEAANKFIQGNKPASEFCYIARCSPDHFVLPLLADHFWQRFGKQSWAVIDEKRNLVLSGENGKKPVLYQTEPIEANKEWQDKDEWENLWKNYHHSINNETRANPKLQKQFMPSRYWKYLTELDA